MSAFNTTPNAWLAWYQQQQLVQQSAANQQGHGPAVAPTQPPFQGPPGYAGNAGQFVGHGMATAAGPAGQTVAVALPNFNQSTLNHLRNSGHITGNCFPDPNRPDKSVFAMPEHELPVWINHADLIATQQNRVAHGRNDTIVYRADFAQAYGAVCIGSTPSRAPQAGFVWTSWMTVVVGKPNHPVEALRNTVITAYPSR